MKFTRSAALMVGALVLALSNPALAHRDGCHRWHSCPSDSGSYVCGDLGYTSECGGSVAEAEVPQYVVPEGPSAAELAERERASAEARAAEAAREAEAARDREAARAAAVRKAAEKAAAEAAAHAKAKLEAETAAAAKAAAVEAAREAQEAAVQAEIVQRARSAFAFMATATATPSPSATTSPNSKVRSDEVIALGAENTSGEEEGNPLLGVLIIAGGAWFVIRKVRKSTAT